MLCTCELVNKGGTLNGELITEKADRYGTVQPYTGRGGGHQRALALARKISLAKCFRRSVGRRADSLSTEQAGGLILPQEEGVGNQMNRLSGELYSRRVVGRTSTYY